MTLSDEAIQIIAKAEQALELEFNNKDLLLEALTHASFFKHKKADIKKDNERLEFLGDAVLKLVSSQYLYEQYPNEDEGKLTKMRATLISDKTCGIVGKSIGLGRLIRFSYGEKRSGGPEKLSNVGNAFEAVLGAIYLDQGIEASQAFFMRAVEASDFSFKDIKKSIDFKSDLQELLQKKKEQLPEYAVVSESGPEHEKVYEMSVTLSIKGAVFSANGKGATKKDAEQQAARDVLAIIKKQ